MVDLAAIKGFLTPEMVGYDGRGRIINGFSNPDDVDRIQKGYACGVCAASFHTFQLVCPLCGTPTEVGGQRQEAPTDWQQHVDTRHADIPTLGKGEREPLPQQQPRPRTPDEFLAALAKDQDVEQVPLSKLGPRRNRSGR